MGSARARSLLKVRNMVRAIAGMAIPHLSNVRRYVLIRIFPDVQDVYRTVQVWPVIWRFRFLTADATVHEIISMVGGMQEGTLTLQRLQL